MTMTESETLQAMLAHHRALGEGVASRVKQVVAASGRFEPASAELVAYLAEEVIPHAIAEEHTVYQVARAFPDLEDTVVGMIDEHRYLVAAVERLAKVSTGAEAVSEAEAIGSFFAAHVA